MKQHPCCLSLKAGLLKKAGEDVGDGIQSLVSLGVGGNGHGCSKLSATGSRHSRNFTPPGAGGEQTILELNNNKTTSLSWCRSSMARVGAVFCFFFLPDYSCPNSTMILQIQGSDTQSRLWLGGSFAACWRALQVFKEKLKFKMKIKSKLDFVSPIVVLLCISLCFHFLLHRSICCLVLGMLLSFPNPWTFRSYFMACCWSSAMFKSSLNAIPRIQCLPCQHNSALCKQNLYSAFFYSLQWISRLIQKYVISPLSSSISVPKSCEF